MAGGLSGAGDAPRRRAPFEAGAARSQVSRIGSERPRIRPGLVVLTPSGCRRVRNAQARIVLLLPAALHRADCHISKLLLRMPSECKFAPEAHFNSSRYRVHDIRYHMPPVLNFSTRASSNGFPSRFRHDLVLSNVPRPLINERSTGQKQTT